MRAELRNVQFETAIIERYLQRESSVEEAMLEMYYAGLSMRRVEDSFAPFSKRKAWTTIRLKEFMRL